MAPSKRSPEVIALGNRLVQELGKHSAFDTLAKWLSTHLAQKILEAEGETDAQVKEVTQSKCVELILRLWEKRQQLLQTARPLGRIQKAIEVLADLHPDQQSYSFGYGQRFDDPTSPWLNFAKNLELSKRRLFGLAFLAGVCEMDLGAERTWIDDHERMLSDEEHRMLSVLNNYFDRSHTMLESTERPRVDEMSPEDRESLILKEIDESLEKHQELIQTLKKQLSERRKKKSRRTSKEI